MKIGAVRIKGVMETAILYDEKIIPISIINRESGIDFPLDLFSLIEDNNAFSKLIKIQERDRQKLYNIASPLDECTYLPPYRTPSKIWSIGLNYREHSDDLKEKLPTDEPASFMKPRTSIIGYGENIVIPDGIGRVTAESEMGIILGKRVRNIDEDSAMDAVLGIVPIIDVTALDILNKNPRFLTRAKSYDTFFSFGPFITTTDEIPDLHSLKVSTIRNGQIVHSNTVDQMTFSPEFLVSFHSRVFTFEAGDILSPGTPGAALISPGDEVRCRFDFPGIPDLVNPVA